MQISAAVNTNTTGQIKDIKQQHSIHARNAATVVESTHMQDLVNQLNDKLGGEVQISVQNVPGNEAAVKRYAVGCESGCSIALAPNQANKLLKDPDEIDTWAARVSEYLDQFAATEEAGEGSTRTGIVFTANGEVKTWASVPSVEQAETEASGEIEDETEETNTGLAGFDYVFKSDGNILKHLMKNTWMILPAWNNTAEEEAAVPTEAEPVAEETIPEELAELSGTEPAEQSGTDSQ